VPFDVTEPIDTPIRVRRWPTERPLFVINVLASACIWIALSRVPSSLTWLFTILGIMFLMHVSFIATIRGSAVRLGPDQFPELYARVETLARRMGMRVPEVYLMQSGGDLNAFATRLFRSHVMVLFSDLLAACGENRAARDMIIGHELGHLRAGHLRGQWILLPTSFMPFMGSALSRAREYTCDRYGLAAAADVEGAMMGLTILAAGGRYARDVNRPAFLRQRDALRGGWMHIGEWMASHPPLTKRIAALAPATLSQESPAPKPRLRWVTAGLTSIGVFLIGGIVLGMWLPKPYSRSGSAAFAAKFEAAEKTTGIQKVNQAFDQFSRMLDADVAAGRPLPWDVYDLYDRWKEVYRDSDAPYDPFDGYWFDYDHNGRDYRLRSRGPDAESHTDDDIIHDSRLKARP
jgi:Zn-dependent protease with chaperone function